MYTKSCILLVLTIILLVNAAPGEKGSPCKVAGFGAMGTHCRDKACGFFLAVPFSRGSCDAGLHCCWGPTLAPQNQPTPTKANDAPVKEVAPKEPKELPNESLPTDETA